MWQRLGYRLINFRPFFLKRRRGCIFGKGGNNRAGDIYIICFVSFKMSINVNAVSQGKNKELEIVLVYRDADRWALNVHNVSVTYSTCGANKGIGLRE